MHRKTGKHHVLESRERVTVRTFLPDFTPETRWQGIKRFFRDYFSPGSIA